MPPPNPPSVPAPAIFAASSGSQAALLERIDARLERIEARLALLDPLIGAAPGLLALAGDTVDGFARELGDLDERLRALVALAERISRPDTLAQLHAALDLLDSSPSLLAIAVDAFDELAREAAARGLALERIVPELGRAIETALRMLSSGHVQHLLDSDLLTPGAIEAVGKAARALATAGQGPEAKLGLFGVLGALREPEVQRAVGFAIDVARRFGTNTDFPQLTPQLTQEARDQ
jgi:uncharacterized protein YjgD (DUF1641 family)